MVGLLGKCLKSLIGRQNQEINFSAVRLALHIVHHGKRSVSSRADYEPPALPGYSLFDRDWRVTELCSELLGRFLPALANLARGL